ncbi:MAG: ferritin [Verrucomicrobiota bacterium]|nr:ferritin [Verrucomicrobiota bacterium]
MLISKAMNAALNQQIGNEFAASLQYVSIAAHFSSEGLPVFARHFFKQSAEEREHAMKFVKYIVDAGGVVEIPSIASPTATFKTAEQAVELSLHQEQLVTQQINKLVALAIQESDHITQAFLSWFLTEQLEEVSSMDNLLKMVQRAGEDRLLYVESFLSGNNAEKAGD